MKLQYQYPLQSHNTFGIKASAEYFTSVTSLTELQEALDFSKDKPCLMLGGGSNILLLSNVKGCVIQMGIKGIEVINEDADAWYVKAMAGENWHQFVMHCINQGYCGLENLSLIPGNVGASPMQNIGAYGVEMKDCFYSLEAWHMQDKRMQTFYAADCEFGYRSSIFKTHAKGEFIICSVTFRLTKQPHIHMSYGAIGQELEKMGVESPGIKEVSEAVIRIRSSKLPDPKVLGNAGSFFKNPVITAEKYHILQQQYPDMASYPQPDGTYKIAAGWLIEKAGWKGKNRGTHGVHTLQALVLVNYGGATGKEIYQLSGDIIDDIQQTFGIELEREVNIIGE